MKTTKAALACVTLLALSLAASVPARAGGGHYRGGHGHYYGHSGVHWGVSIGLPFYYPGYYSSYYYPPYYSPYYYPGYGGYYPGYGGYYPGYGGGVVPGAPQTYVERGADEAAPQATQSWWYFCPESKTYYPYVRQCPGGWQKVAPQPPAQ